MSNDIDFEQFIQLLDGALASDDKNVKQALKKFLFVAAMVMGDDTEPGPFTQMMDTIDSLQRRVVSLENPNTYTTTDNMWGTGIGTTANPPYINTTGTAGAITLPNATPTATTITLPNATTTGTTYTITNNPNSTTATALWYDMNEPKTGTNIKEEIKEGLEKLAKSA